MFTSVHLIGGSDGGRGLVGLCYISDIMAYEQIPHKVRRLKTSSLDISYKRFILKFSSYQFSYLHIQPEIIA